jgi:excisionase family DNA binding protein
MDRLLVRPTEAAEILGLGRSKVYELLASGELPSVRIGKSIRVPLEALRQWVDARTAGSDPPYVPDPRNTWSIERRSSP